MPPEMPSIVLSRWLLLDSHRSGSVIDNEMPSYPVRLIID